MSDSSYVSEPPEGEEPFIINKKIFRGLKKFGWSLVPRKRYVSLHFYMDRAEEINPDITNDVENPSHVLIFAMQLLNDNVFQPLGSIFFRKSTPVEIISSCIKGYIKDLSMCELTVINTLCPASNYLREVVEDLVGVENFQNKTEAYVYNIDRVKITHIYDPPSMLSEVKREFMNSSIMFTQYYTKYKANYEDIKKVIKYRSNNDIENAIQLFSFDTKGKVRRQKFKGEIKNDASAEICAFFNILFDTFNGGSSSNNTNRMPLTANSVHKDVWKNALTVLKSMKCVKNSTETKIQHSKDSKASGTKNHIKKETKIPKRITFEDNKEMNDVVDKVEEAVNMVVNDINKIDLVSLKYYENMPKTSESEDNITNHQQLTKENIKKDLTENHKNTESVCNPNVENNSRMDAVDKQQCVTTKMKKKKSKKNKHTAKMNASVPVTNDDSKSNKTVAENVNINVSNQIVNEENVANLHNAEFMKSQTENKLNTIYEDDSMNIPDYFKSYDPTEFMDKENDFSFLENILKSTANDDTTKELSKQKMYSDYAVMLFNQKHKDKKKENSSAVNILSDADDTHNIKNEKFEVDSSYEIEQAKEEDKLILETVKLSDSINVLSNDMQNKSEIIRKDNIRTSDAIPNEIEKNCQNCSNKCGENGNCCLVKNIKKNKKSKKSKISQICLLHETKKTIVDQFSNFKSANGVSIENQDLAKCNENQNKVANVNEETENSLNELECTSLPSGCTEVSSETINSKTNGNEHKNDTKIETVENEHNEICQLTNVDSLETINSKTNGNEQLYDTKIETIQNELNEIFQLTNVDINNKSNDVTLISPSWEINKKEKNISEIVSTKELKSDANITYKKSNSVDETIVFFNKTLGNHLHETIKNVSKDVTKQNIDIQNISTAVDSENIISVTNKIESIIENPFRKTIKNTSKSSKGNKQKDDIPNSEQKEKHFLQTTQNMYNDIDRKENTVCHSQNIMKQIAQKINNADCDKHVQQNDSDILGNIPKKTEKLECLSKDCGIKKNIDEKIQEENFNKMIDHLQNKIEFAITPNEFRNCMEVAKSNDIFENAMNEKNENVSSVKFSLNEELTVENQDIKKGSIKENRIEEISNLLMPHTSIDGDGELNCIEKEDLITKSNKNSGTNSNTETISDNEAYPMEVDNVIEEDLECTDDNIENGFRPYVLDAWIITINGMKEIFKDMCNKRFDSINTMQYNLNTLRCLIAELQKVNHIPNAETNMNFAPQFVDYDLFQIFLSPEASITVK